MAKLLFILIPLSCLPYEINKDKGDGSIWEIKGTVLFRDKGDGSI